jgi:hypothetical protein
MLVQVNWTNKTYDYVHDFMLQDLIEAGGVARFLRGSGWVTVGADPIRSGSPACDFIGVERRGTIESQHCEEPAHDSMRGRG